MTDQPVTISELHQGAALPAAPAAPAAIKPGWKTTEFYAGWAVKILGALMTTGILGDGTIAARIVGAALTLFAYLGYTYSRTVIKAAVVPLIIMAFGSSSISCDALKANGDATIRAVIDCTKAEKPQLVAAVVQLSVDLVGYYSKLGSPDWDALVDQAIADASDIKACAIAEYKAAKAKAETLRPVARVASGQPDKLEVAFVKLRAARGGPLYLTSHGAI